MAKRRRKVPPRVLVVVDRDYATPQLLRAVRERVAAGTARFHVIVPHGAHGHKHIPEPGVGAHRALKDAVAKVSQVASAEVTGEVGDASALTAIQDAANREGAAEVILSTRPSRTSRLTRMDLPRRVRGLGLPVVHVEA